MKFREYIPEQNWLIPPNIEDEIPEKDLVRVINTIIDGLDLSAFKGKYKEVGNVAYNPRLMLKVILYSYQQGIFSSRKMERAAQRNIYYWYLTGKQTPNFRTLCKFIKRHQNEIEDVFSQVLWVCQKEGLINLETVAVDGSVIKANASRDALWDTDRVQSELIKLRSVASEYLNKHIEADELENSLKERTDNQSDKDNITDTSNRLSKLLEQVKKVKSIEQKLSESTKKRINTTDPDSYLNGKRGKPKEMSYNSNIVVESSNQVIVSADLDNYNHETHMVPKHIDYGTVAK